MCIAENYATIRSFKFVNYLFNVLRPSASKILLLSRFGYYFAPMNTKVLDAPTWKKFDEDVSEGEFRQGSEANFGFIILIA